MIFRKTNMPFRFVGCYEKLGVIFVTSRTRYILWMKEMARLAEEKTALP